MQEIEIRVARVPHLPTVNTALGKFTSLEFCGDLSLGARRPDLFGPLLDLVLKKVGGVAPYQVDFRLNNNLLVRVTSFRVTEFDKAGIKVSVYKPLEESDTRSLAVLNSQSESSGFSRKEFSAPFIEVNGKVHELVAFRKLAAFKIYEDKFINNDAAREVIEQILAASE